MPYRMTRDTRWRYESDECASVHKKYTSIYIRLTHLVVSSQRLSAVRSRKG